MSGRPGAEGALKVEVGCVVLRFVVVRRWGGAGMMRRDWLAGGV